MEGALWVSEKGRGRVGRGNDLSTVLGRLVLEQWRVGQSERNWRHRGSRKLEQLLWTLDG